MTSAGEGRRRRIDNFTVATPSRFRGPALGCTNTLAAGSERVASAAGRVTTKRAPPPSASPSSTRPPWASVTARTIARPRPLLPLRRRVAVAAGEALEHALAHGRRHARPAVGHLEHGVRRRRGAPRRSPACRPACGSARSRSGCRRGGEGRRPSPFTITGPGRSSESGWSDDSAPASRAASAATAARSTGPRGSSRPASARASSSRSPTSRRMRRDERSAESAMSRCSPASSASSSSRFARMLVSGVRSSCDASATNLRWRASVASVSPRAALSSPSMSSKVCARSETSSFALRLRAA